MSLEEFHERIKGCIEESKDPSTILEYTENLIDFIEKDLFEKMLELCKEANIVIPEEEEELEKLPDSKETSDWFKRCKCGEIIKKQGHELCYSCYKLNKT